jgi:hypothetical protein
MRWCWNDGRPRMKVKEGALLNHVDTLAKHLFVFSVRSSFSWQKVAGNTGNLPEPHLSVPTAACEAKPERKFAALIRPLVFFFFLRFGGSCHSFHLFYINRADNILYILLEEHHSCCPHCFPLGRGPPLGCRAEIRTRACHTASRRATIWATPHPKFEPHRTLEATPHPKSHTAP